MREVITRIFDVIVFWTLFTAGVSLQMSLDWPAGIEVLFFVPLFACIFYLHPDDDADQRLPLRSFAKLIGCIVIGMTVAFDVLKLPGGSYLATFIVVGIMAVTRSVVYESPASKVR